MRFFIIYLITVGAVLSANTIQTQISTDGNFELSLIRAQVKNNVLTFQTVIKNTSTKRRQYSFYFKDVYFTDSKAKNKYYALKDTKGNYIAGPAHDHFSGGSFNVTLNPMEKAVFWIKFPAPKKTTETVDLYIPWALPFESIKPSK